LSAGAYRFAGNCTCSTAISQLSHSEWAWTIFFSSWSFQKTKYHFLWRTILRATLQLDQKKLHAAV